MQRTLSRPKLSCFDASRILPKITSLTLGVLKPLKVREKLIGCDAQMSTQVSIQTPLADRLLAESIPITGAATAMPSCADNGLRRAEISMRKKQDTKL